MKKLLIGLFLSICAIAPAKAANPIYQYVRMGTATVIVPALQVGGFNTSSGSVQNFTGNTITTKYLTVNSTASFAGVTGSTISYSSATFTNVNVTGIGTIGAANVTGSENVEGTLTVVSSSTLRGNLGVLGNVDQPLTVTSSTTLRGNVGINGNVDQPLTITSSSTLTGNVLFSSMVGTNFTATNSTMTNVSVGTSLQMNSNKITGLANGTASSNAAAYGQLKIIQVVNFSATASSATTLATSFIDSKVTASITPTSASNKVFVIVTCNASIGSGTGGRYGAVTIKRGSTNLGGTNGGLGTFGGLPAGTYPFAVTVSYLDSPATTSATSYTLGIKPLTGGDTVTVPEAASSGDEPYSITLMEVVP